MGFDWEEVRNGERGRIIRRTLHLTDLPTGDSVNLNVIFVIGAQEGPNALITSNIHGDEVTGIIVVHRVVDYLSRKLEEIKGTIILIPSLNPTGFLSETRFPQFQSTDPNRTWKDSKPKKEKEEKEREYVDIWADLQKKNDDRDRTQTLLFKPIFQFFEESGAEMHLDLHTCSTLSLPFIFVDRILYSEKDNGEAEKKKAITLFDKLTSFTNSLGLTVIQERPFHLYISDKLHKSTSGSVLNNMKIPSCTIEMGGNNVVDPHCRDASITSVLNGLRWAGNLSDPIESIINVKVLSFPKPHRYLSYPIAPATGILDTIINVGDQFKKGDKMGLIRKMDGTIKEEIIAEVDGYLIAWYNGIGAYQSDCLGIIAVDDGNLPHVLSWESLSD